ncbi:MAG: hypothetical protein SF028_12265 [Candidatus Sumerlaeia bacterium]|nr:hypothetical protein [Candidatus Sumerlaeia bacterium]
MRPIALLLLLFTFAGCARDNTPPGFERFTSPEVAMRFVTVRNTPTAADAEPNVFSSEWKSDKSLRIDRRSQLQFMVERELADSPGLQYSTFATIFGPGDGGAELIATADIGSLVLLPEKKWPARRGRIELRVSESAAAFYAPRFGGRVPPQFALDAWVSGLRVDVVEDIEAEGRAVTRTELLALARDHGVLALRDALETSGYPASLADAQRLRNANISSEYINELPRARFDLSTDEVIRLRNSNVSSAYVQEVRDAKPTATSEEIIRLRHANVDPGYAGEVLAARPELTLADVTRLRHANVSGDFAGAVLRQRRDFGVEDVIRLRHANVSLDWFREISEASRKPLSSQALVKLRHSNISSETFREIQGLDP